MTALRRRDVDTRKGVVRVERSFSERSSGELLAGPPKSRAGHRSVALPGPVTAALADHLRALPDTSPDALVFTTGTGRAFRRSNFNTLVKWTAAVAAVGVPGLHFHDLRHTGNTLAAESGANLRDLMARMGHDSMQAALIYQHRAQGADRRIAAAMEDQIAAAQESSDNDDDGDDGPAGALVPAG